MGCHLYIAGSVERGKQHMLRAVSASSRVLYDVIFLKNKLFFKKII